MVKKTLVTVALVIALLSAYVALQPSHFEISREMQMSASAEQIFPYINSSEKANDWMPWKDSDPSVKMVYSGPAEGVGSTSSWEGEGQMGTGKAEVVESIPNRSVKTQLTYTRPMEMSQLAEISLTPAATGTTVRWSVTGENSFIGRCICLFMNMDKMVGGEFEKGLTKLKGIVEAEAARSA